MPQAILPYHYPTTVICVDDEKSFLENFRIRYGADFAVRLFSFPEQAADFINAQVGKETLAQRCVSYFKQDDFIQVDMALLEQEINHADRFSEISVIVVDYKMPGTDGLQFCRQIKNKKIKKILLTGIGDESLAVDAFNKGIIDKFIKKNDPSASTLIEQSIKELQCRYLIEVTAVMQDMLSLKSPGFLADPSFINYFKNVLRSHDYLEFYYMENPSGFLLLDGSGNVARMLVLDDADLSKAAAFAESKDAPAAILELIRSGEQIPYFWDEDQESVWTECMVPAEKLTVKAAPDLGLPEKTLYCGLYLSPPVDIDFEKSQSNYSHFVDTQLKTAINSQ